tara:strand:+ start:845 stop:1201 length:357 start_codon:yes stop_codon:yes gene_type:complete
MDNNTNYEELSSAVVASLGIQTTMGKEALIESLGCISLFDQKQQDYGPKNIAAFEDKTMNMLATTIRLNDKVQRLLNLLQKQAKDPNATPNNESIRDSARDVSNYGLILALLEGDKWK